MCCAKKILNALGPDALDNLMGSAPCGNRTLRAQARDDSDMARYDCGRRTGQTKRGQGTGC